MRAPRSPWSACGLLWLARSSALPTGITAAGLGDTAIHGQIELLHLATSDHAGSRNRLREEAARRLGIPTVYRGHYDPLFRWSYHLRLTRLKQIRLNETAAREQPRRTRLNETQPLRPSHPIWSIPGQRRDTGPDSLRRDNRPRAAGCAPRPHRGLHPRSGASRSESRHPLVPLAPLTVRAIDAALGDRTDGPLLVSNNGGRLDRHDAARIVARLARKAGLAKHPPPTPWRRPSQKCCPPPPARMAGLSPTGKRCQVL